VITIWYSRCVNNNYRSRSIMIIIESLVSTTSSYLNSDGIIPNRHLHLPGWYGSGCSYTWSTSSCCSCSWIVHWPATVVSKACCLIRHWLYKTVYTATCISWDKVLQSSNPSTTARHKFNSSVRRAPGLKLLEPHVIFHGQSPVGRRQNGDGILKPEKHGKNTFGYVKMLQSGNLALSRIFGYRFPV
jgi:hypothetical protein